MKIIPLEYIYEIGKYNVLFYSLSVIFKKIWFHEMLYLFEVLTCDIDMQTTKSPLLRKAI